MKFTWVHVLCLIVVGASAQSFDSGFRLNGFNNVKGRCGNGFGGRAPVIEISPIRTANFIRPDVAHQTCDCVKAKVRQQMKKQIIAIPSVQNFFRIPSNSIIQTTPFGGSRNIQIPALPLPSLKMFVEVTPTPIVDDRHTIFSDAYVGPSISRPICGLDKNFRKTSNGALSWNSFGAARRLVGSFQGAVGTGFNARVNDAAIPRSYVVRWWFC